jgi:hypothetical protein
MNAHKLAATLKQDGTILLEGLPFHAGDTVEIIILEQPQEKPTSPPQQTEYPLQGKQPYRYDEPFESVLDKDYLDAVAATLTEWNSEADELA